MFAMAKAPIPLLRRNVQLNIPKYSHLLFSFFDFIYNNSRFNPFFSRLLHYQSHRPKSGLDFKRTGYNLRQLIASDEITGLNRCFLDFSDLRKIHFSYERTYAVRKSLSPLPLCNSPRNTEQNTVWCSYNAINIKRSNRERLGQRAIYIYTAWRSMLHLFLTRIRSHCRWNTHTHTHVSCARSITFSKRKPVGYIYIQIFFLAHRFQSNNKK